MRLFITAVLFSSKSVFRQVIPAVLTGAMLSCNAMAQDKPDGLPRFEVVSIKLTAPDTNNWRLEFNPGMMRIQNRTLFDIIRFAYDLRSDSQLLNAPEWVKSDRFDILGKEDEELAKKVQEAQRQPGRPFLRQLVRTMLEDRFRMKISQKSVEAPAYALIVAKRGVKTRPYDPADGKHFRGLVGPSGNVEARGVSMKLLADSISDMPEAGGRVVVDRTDLPGDFSWTLHWTPEIPGSGVHNYEDPDKPDLFTALEEQLGLTLKSQKSSIQVVVIDHIEKPAEN